MDVNLFGFSHVLLQWHKNSDNSDASTFSVFRKDYVGLHTNTKTVNWLFKSDLFFSGFGARFILFLGT